MLKSEAEKKSVVDETVKRLKNIYPEAVCALKWGKDITDSWKLMIMGRLSAQCTDERVNMVCEELFKKYPTAGSLAQADIECIENIIRPCGLYHVKASDIKEECILLTTEYGGIVPDDMDELLKFPGVGRKIANLLLGDIYHKPGIVADTHCIRICARLGMYPESQKNPLKTEQIMSALVEPEEQSDFCHRIVQYGRDVCRAAKPACGECCLSDICDGKRN